MGKEEQCMMKHIYLYIYKEECLSICLFVCLFAMHSVPVVARITNLSMVLG